ncbi:MAG: hypothetical protein M3Y48_08235 [Actinomycetota bacterium]|nr:hypothetical protein [Actinomycetota bacterium]
MSTARALRPRGFELRLPESWLEFDIWRATRTRDLPRLLDSRIAEHPELKPYRGALVKALRQAASEAERNDAVFCAAMSELVEDAGMLAATVMVFQTDGRPDPADNTVEAIASQLTSIASIEGAAQWRRVGIVEIPAGRAVRVQGVEPVDLGAQSVHCVVMQTLIPVPNDGSGVLNVVATSPQVELAESMLDLFDAISSTLTWSTIVPGGNGVATLN